MAKCILAGSVNAFGYVLWETHSLFFCCDTAPDLLKIRKESYPNALIQPPKMHLGMCLSAVALCQNARLIFGKCSCFYGFPY